MRSGFVTLVGRPNAGKSTLLNCLVGAKVSIASAKPQTTRLRVMGVRHLRDAQIVFVDTPGIAKPVTSLGEQLNETARTAIADLEPVDVICMVLDATAPLGRGDRLIWESLPAGASTVVAVTKCDRASRAQVLAQLAAAAEFDAGAYFPVSGITGDGTDALITHLAAGLAEGPAYFPPESITDLPDAWRISEAVREQLLARLDDELPYSIAGASHRMGAGSHPLRHRSGTALPERDRHRSGRTDAPRCRHSGTPRARSRRRVPRAASSRRAGLAAHP